MDCCDKCSTQVQERDLEYINSRLLNEGLSFLTITLPQFLDDMMTCIEEGKITSLYFIGFKKYKCIPAFLQGFTKLIFEPNTGVLYDVEEINHNAVFAIRQICSAFKKVKLNCSEKRNFAAIHDFYRVDAKLQEKVNSITDRDWDDFSAVTRLITAHVFGDMVENSTLIPKHGPGSTADRKTGNKKYIPDYGWPLRLSWAFEKDDVMFSSSLAAHKSKYEPLEMRIGDELPVRVVTVPKTQSKPRVIALEPTVMQYTQQAVKDYVVDRIESNPLTGGHVNFTDQKINQKLALHSSKFRDFATLDLSAASDRVHSDLIYEMLSVNPTLRDLVFITRSNRATISTVQGDITFYLRKFASMGSALCFPMEAMYFYCLVVLASIRKHKLPISLKSIKCVSKKIYVYGDDIIIPVDSVDSVCETLSVFGNVVSLKKSFSKGYFRESCGMDAFNGKDVTPIYVRRQFPDRKTEVSEVVSMIATANLLYKKGCIRSAMYLRKQVEAVVGSLPAVGETSPGLGWAFDVENKPTTRFNKRLQRLEVQTLVVKSIKHKDRLTNYPALLKCLQTTASGLSVF
jgi:hypothetical protein